MGRVPGTVVVGTVGGRGVVGTVGTVVVGAVVVGIVGFLMGDPSFALADEIPARDASPTMETTLRRVFERSRSLRDPSRAFLVIVFELLLQKVSATSRRQALEQGRGQPRR